MSYHVSKKSIGLLDDLVKKTLVAYVDYGAPNTGRVFAWPRFVIEGEKISPIEREALPSAGCLPLSVANGAPTKRKLQSTAGKLVVMKINEVGFQTNTRWEAGEEPHELNGLIDPARQPGASMVEFTAFDSFDVSYRFVQVVNLEGGRIDFSKPRDKSVYPCSDQAEPTTRYIMVAQANAGKKLLYGPFEAQQSPDRLGGWSLKPSRSFDSFVYAIDQEEFAFNIEINDENDFIFAQFVDVDELSSIAKAKSAACYDWMPEDELRDALARVAKSTLPDLTRADIKKLKEAAGGAQEAEAKVAMSPERRARMAELVDKTESWADLTDAQRVEAVAGVDPDELASIMLSEENFPTFYNLVSENGEVKRRVEAAEGAAADRIIAAQRKMEAAEKEADKAQARLDETEAAIAKAKQTVEEMKKQAIDEAGAELETVNSEIQARRGEINNLDARINELRRSEYAASDAVRKVVSDFSSEGAVSEEILKSAAIRQIVESLSSDAGGTAEDAQAENTAPAVPCTAAEAGTCALVAVDEEFSAQAIVERVWNSVCAKGGRDFSKNEIANLLICLTQSRITTLAGLPGTGKTSLAGLLAGALGLVQPGARRFCEISVERGWRGYEDFVGYYSPFTGRVEPGHADAFAAFASLDAEAGDDGEHAPYLMLLDEANLSPVEHYWSPFLLACDKPDDSAMPLSLGGGQTFRAPGWLRFVATVNFDHTTEELSPRFLDRSWVIMLSSAAFDIESDGAAPCAADFGDLPAYSFTALRKTFARPGAKPKAASMAKLREVLAACDENGLPVSARSQLMMKRYIASADEIMNTKAAATSGDPVDFAVSQKILPSIHGGEEEVRALLEAVGGVAGLPRTRAHVERMIKAGEANGFYQFFA